MSVSKEQTAANANVAEDAGALDATQLDYVVGGDAVIVQPVTTNKQTTAQKQADKADSYIRS